MRRGLAVGLGLILAAASCTPEGQDDDDTSAPLEGTAGFTGRVVSYPEGDPIEGMSVVVFDVQARYEIFTTDADGAFSASELFPGFYRAKAWPLEGQNFIGAYHDDMYFYCTGTLLDLRRGGQLTDVDFRLPHGGVIAGTVTDTDSGEPLDGARVDVRGLDYYNSNLDPTVYTDADGRFEVVGLDSAIESLETLIPVPGNYELKVTVPGRPVFYYPGVYDPDTAEPVTALRGEIGEGWDLALPPGGAIRGRVTDVDGEPAEGGSISARHGELTWASVTVGLGDDGTFELGGLAPGGWSLEVRPDGLAALAPTEAIDVPEDGLVEELELISGPAARL
ncbi:MAG: carboxypeptidase-like regulatory domain-containing protein, partial [Myxococcota bacterium]|nr:carboxypeptidase-like regulatory domain-containing protein [Myxococcota bacterium]